MAEISEAAKAAAEKIIPKFATTRECDKELARRFVGRAVQDAIEAALASHAAEVERLREALQRSIVSLGSIEEELLESPTKETCRLARIMVIDCRVGLRVTLKSTPTPTEAR